MGFQLWMPSKERIEQANIVRFIDFVNKTYDLKIQDYWQLYQWSVYRIPDSWAAIWKFAGVIASQGYDRVVDDLGKFPGARWFLVAKLNFAENLMKYRDDHLAVIFRGETPRARRVTYGDLLRDAARLASWLRGVGVAPGDMVCAYLPNLIETVAAMLAATSIGAVWASCGAELGPAAVLNGDCLGQACLGQAYLGQTCPEQGSNH